jgi:phosphoribosylformimino-5-aminoimidazole carboxamide ribotide isomerase
MGGGLRTMEAIRGILKAGIDKVILGTIVVEEAGIVREAFEEFRGQIMVALDVKNGNVATRGWKDDSGFPVQDALQIVEKLGGKEIIFTDIGRDGTMSGVNLMAVQAMMAITSLKIYASGGVTSLDDVKQLKSINSPGCIIGKAIYEGKLDLAQAIKIASN